MQLQTKKFERNCILSTISCNETGFIRQFEVLGMMRLSDRIAVQKQTQASS